MLFRSEEGENADAGEHEEEDAVEKHLEEMAARQGGAGAGAQAGAFQGPDGDDNEQMFWDRDEEAEAELLRLEEEERLRVAAGRAEEEMGQADEAVAGQWQDEHRCANTRKILIQPHDLSI